MYEGVTYESILERMLNRIPNTMDKREGSVIYDALAPAAIELQQIYIEFDLILNETFGDTASRAFLIRRASERGITPYPASKAVVKAECSPTDVAIGIGSRFSLGDLNYSVIEIIGGGVYKLECETTGSDGNDISGTLIPIDYISGLETITLTELLIPGEDEEETEHFRERYFKSFDAKAYGGNKTDYIEKTNSISGVGATKVTPVWNGGGTVKLTILNSQYDKASDTLIETVQDIIDPTGDGAGLGIAPIGHIVTIDTPTEIPINIHTAITFQEGYSFDRQKTLIENAVKDYLLELRKEWADSDSIVIRSSQINTCILGVFGVTDVSDTTLNDNVGNIEIGTYEIPVFGGIEA